ncbi:MAG: hypothetical protein F4X29_13350 [Rhodothermaceae bacterium]|nr:hypothetical protein [Rhodothermaceae bacterium]
MQQSLFIMDFLPDTFWKLVVAVFVLIGAVVAVKVGFTFNINQWQESKRKRLKEKLQAKCPHAVPIKEGGNLGLESSFLSPSGTTGWVCRRCGLVTHDMRGATYMLERYLNNPEQYIKQDRAFHKVHKKLYG